MSNFFDADDAVRFASVLARQAGALAVNIRAENRLDAKAKSDEETDIVTEADRASEALITKALADRYPDHGVRGEEGASEPGASGFNWVIDPIDGTLNFSRHKPFSVSIGCLRDGQPLLGVLYFPDDDVLLSAIVGKGALRDGKPFARNAAVLLKDARMCFDVSSGGDANEEQRRFRLPLEGNVMSIERSYCCTHAARRILQGDIDCYVCGGLTPFDLGAMALILREAGCVADGLLGPIDFSVRKTPFVAATDERLKNAIVNALR